MKSILLLLFATTTVFAGGRYHEDFHYSYPQTPGGRFSLDGFNGTVEISGWDQNTVEITGTKFADSHDVLNAIRVEVSSTGNSVTVHTEHPEFHHFGRAGTTYVVHVPRRTELEQIHSSNGALRVDSIDGNCTLHTSNGSIQIHDVHGNVNGSSSNGLLDLARVDGRMTLHTSNGGIHGDEVSGGIEGRTSNGSIRLRLRESQTGDPIRLVTSNGSVELEMNSPRTNDVIASSSNGSITVRMPESAAANLSAHTSGHNRVVTDFDVRVHGTISKSRLDGVIGNGGPRMELTTSNGGIRLLKI
ncbi:MAG TPA: DUF4097 family beta strand repeat-containing protein [Bryobacteraceae bacterium]|nr:DUF4097 family beta strand repeat-containing protein [Bryobacteraceae bacterium]